MTLPPELTLELIKLYKQKQILHEHEFDFVQVNVSYLSETHPLATEDLLVYLDMVNDVDSSPAVQAVAQARTANCEAALAKSEHQMFQLMQKVRKLRTRMHDTTTKLQEAEALNAKHCKAKREAGRGEDHAQKEQ